MQAAPSPTLSTHVSVCTPNTTDWGLPHPSKDPSESPTLKLLVCADIDIDSSSDLVDYTLQQQVFDTTLIDIVVIAGSFVRESDLEQYIKTKNYRQRPETHLLQLDGTIEDYMLPLLRSYEESSALEGVVTSIIAQLENVVCRVVYCPGLSDPITILRDPTKRLTSNSRNIHKQSLPLVPGLSMAGLMYLDGVDELIRDLGSLSQSNRLDADEEGSVSENSEQSITLERLVEQLQTLKIGNDDYESILDQLVDLSNLASDTVPVPECATTILVSNYVACQPKAQHNDAFGCEPSSSTKPSPWPVGHDQYLESRRTSICLEIAAGGTLNQPSYDQSSGILIPGSLRDCGAFSIVTLQMSGEGMQWMVKNVEHVSIPGYKI